MPRRSVSDIVQELMRERPTTPPLELVAEAEKVWRAEHWKKPGRRAGQKNKTPEERAEAEKAYRFGDFNVRASVRNTDGGAIVAVYVDDVEAGSSVVAISPRYATFAKRCRCAAARLLRIAMVPLAATRAAEDRARE